MRKEKRDLLLILVWPIIASALSILLKADDALISTMLFFGVPSIYLSFRKKELIKKVALFSLITSIPTGIIIDYVMEVTQGWYLHHSVFGEFRLFNYVNLEQLIWLFLFFYFVAMFYEVFLEKECKPKLKYPSLKYWFIILLALFGIFLLLYTIRPSRLNIDYFYLKVGIFAVIIPLALILFRFPNLIGKFAKTGLYFLYLSLIYEVTALHLGQWGFPAENQFIGYITFHGVIFPWEEFLFWIVLGSITAIAYYEFFDDDRK